MSQAGAYIITTGPGAVVESLTGNSGTATPTAGNINIVTANTNVKFVGSGSTITQDFAPNTNLALGTSLPALGAGTANSCFGVNTGFSLSSGNSNVYVGKDAGAGFSSGSNNVFVGAFSANSGVGNSGSSNVGIGESALNSLTSGTANIAIGTGAGLSVTTISNTISIGTGVSAPANGIIIGLAGTNTTCRIAGIDGVNVGSTVRVVTEATNQLGTADITAGTGIVITPSANAITISAIGEGLTWSTITVNQTAVVDNGYFCNKAGTLALALPAASAVGDVIEVTNENTALGVQFTQAAGQQILIGPTNTTLGATGTLTSSAVGDTLKIVCKTANTIWRVTSMVGNWTIV